MMTKQTRANLKLGLLAVLACVIAHLVYNGKWPAKEELSPFFGLDPQKSHDYSPLGSKEVPAKWGPACQALELSIPGPITSQDPHAGHFIRVHANSVARNGIADRATNPLPVGSAVVKEKYRNSSETTRFAYAAMVKREPGYDADHGDWEYVYVAIEGGHKVARGRLANCIDCHKKTSSTDYVFLNYDDVETSN